MPGAQAALVPRRPRAAALEAIAADLRVRGASRSSIALLDANDLTRHAGGDRGSAGPRYGGFDVALIAHGVLPDQAASERSVAATLASFDTNAALGDRAADLLANRFEAQGQRRASRSSRRRPATAGGPSNYVYGAAKAAVDRVRLRGCATGCTRRACAW